MVSLSPDTHLGCDWKGGYVYGDKSILCFSHIHGWQMYGVPIMPSTGEFHGNEGLKAAASEFLHDSEVAHPGYYKVCLQRYGITAELTSTARVGFHRYTFPACDSAHIAFDTSATLMGPMTSSEVRRISDSEIAGQSVMSPTQPRRKKPFTVYFIAQFNKPMKFFGGWSNRRLLGQPVDRVAGRNVGAYVGFATTNDEQLLVKVAISYVSEANARRNLEAELPHWDFDRVVRESTAEWDRELGRIEVEGGTRAQRVKFYTDLWHVLLGRGIVSDTDGSYCDMTGDHPVIRHVQINSQGRPGFPHYNFDALWGSHWSLNILWSFVYPEVMDGFCNTMVDMYRDGGLIPRGPTGNNYSFVMIGDPAAPFFAAAFNKGIRHYDAEKAYEGLRKNALPGGIRDHADYETSTNACGGGMKYYVERGYVPEGIKSTGWDLDGASMTLEYAYEDWCLAQFASALGKKDDAQWLFRRSFNYTNLWDASTKLMRPRNKDGTWLRDFHPFGPKSAKGFCEANAAIYTYFVPQDVPGLVRLFGGSEKFVGALNQQFEHAAGANFVAPRDQDSSACIDYGNEPSMAMAHMFNFAGAPWLAQKWVRAVKQQAYGDITPFGGYNGDEDQGQLGALGVLMAIGLFDVQGGAELNPTYQITSPIFDRVVIHLNPDYFPGREFVINSRNNSATNQYIQAARLNGQDLGRCWFPHDDLVKGGTLELELGSQPNQKWGIEINCVSR